MRTRSKWPGSTDPSRVWSMRPATAPSPVVPVPSVEEHGDKAVIRVDALAPVREVAGKPYVGPDGLVETFAAAANVKGTEGRSGQSIKGDTGQSGVDGNDGWTPITTGERDGVRSLIFVDYIGGEGTKPASGYIGPAGSTGLVSKANAFNFNPARSLVYMGTTNAQGDYTVTLPEPMNAPYICPTLYPSTAPERFIRLTSITRNAQGKTTGFTVRVEQRAALTVLGLQLLAAAVTNVANANVSVIVVDVS